MAKMPEPVPPCPFNIGDVVRAKGQHQAMTVLEIGSTWKDPKQHRLVAVWVDDIGEKWLPWAALEVAPKARSFTEAMTLDRDP